MKKICKNCKFAKFELTERGNIRHQSPGECLYEVEKPKFPMSVFRSSGYYHYWPPSKSAIWYNDLNECECFEPRGE